ncbi:MAG: hypothetical protein JXQ30_01975 [Spirochaetes bacterium]|nr:hypothetical protein [Spirochaetota bacterium]
MKKSTEPLKVAFVHHHLRRGGVSKVISQQIGALGGLVRPLLVTGEAPEQSPPYAVEVVAGLAYDRDRTDRDTPKEIAGRLESAVFGHFGGRADILHFHNPTLGKNKDFIAVIDILKSGGHRTLLQIHDFAEDGRPANYSKTPYPRDCHYAVLNSKDYGVLRKAGLKPEGLHIIPNPVPPLAGARSPDADLVLYPVRAIRRKNIGEAVFLSLFLDERMTVGVTLEPTGELDRRSLDGWKRFVRERGLRAVFRLGLENRFEDILARSECMITTSIKEGFGYCFLEPWTADRMLFGRLLPEVCADFERAGVAFPSLYGFIDIPLDYFDSGRFVEKWKRCFLAQRESYGLSSDERTADEGIGSVVRDGSVDFCYLSEDLQRQVIDTVLQSPRAFDKMLDINPFLNQFFSLKERKKLIARNKEAIKGRYSRERCCTDLSAIYRAVMGREVSHAIDKRVLLEQFVTRRASHLLLCDAAYE